MHNRLFPSVPPAPRRLSAFTETGGALTWTVPAGVARVAVLVAPELAVQIRAFRQEQP